MGVTKDNKALFVQNNHGYVGKYKNNTNKDRYNDMYYGIGNFPVLLDKGQDVLSFYWPDEIDRKMKSKQMKGFICHTQDWNTIYMWQVPAKTIYEMPAYLKSKYGCWNAINLDAGGSSAVYANGKYLVGPWRNIVDAYVIVGEKEETEKEVKKESEDNREIQDNKEKTEEAKKEVAKKQVEKKENESYRTSGNHILPVKYRTVADSIIVMLKKKSAKERNSVCYALRNIYMYQSSKLNEGVKALIEYILDDLLGGNWTDI